MNSFLLALSFAVIGQWRRGQYGVRRIAAKGLLAQAVDNSTHWQWIHAQGRVGACGEVVEADWSGGYS